MSILGSIFIFICGGISSLLLVLYLFVKFVTTAEKKVEEDKAKVLADLITKRSEFERTHTSGVKDDSKPMHLNDKKGWAKRRTGPPLESTKNNNSEGKDVFLILKANMLFQFVDDRSEKCEGITCLDGYKLTTSPVKANGNPSYKQGSCIVLSKDNNDSLYFTFEQVRELEAWYLAFAKAATLTSKDLEVQKDYQRAADFWSKLNSVVVNRKVDVSPHWVTALACRIWWGIQSSEGFKEFVMDKITKKLDKIKKPPLVQSIKLQDINFGPHLPIIHDIQLSSFSAMGEVVLDGEIEYHGGFKLTIEINFLITIAGRSLSLPVAISVRILHLKGRARFQFLQVPSSRFYIGFYEEPACDLQIETEIGENKKLLNIPKLANIAIQKIKSELLEMMVLPNMDDYPLPKVKSRAEQAKKHLQQHTTRLGRANSDGVKFDQNLKEILDLELEEKKSV